MAITCKEVIKKCDRRIAAAQVEIKKLSALVTRNKNQLLTARAKKHIGILQKEIEGNRELKQEALDSAHQKIIERQNPVNSN